MERVYLFQMPETAQIEKTCRKLKVRCSVVPQEKFAMAIGTIAGIHDIPQPQAETTPLPQEGIMVMADFSSARLTRLLEGLRKEQCMIHAYKAVLTPTNSAWNVYQLAAELQKEREKLKG